jgi:hypothetical protein
MSGLVERLFILLEGICFVELISLLVIWVEDLRDILQLSRKCYSPIIYHSDVHSDPTQLIIHIQCKILRYEAL